LLKWHIIQKRLNIITPGQHSIHRSESISMSSMVGINNFFTRVLCPSLENQLFISQQAPLLMWTKRRAEGAMVAGTVAMALSSSGVWWVLSWISLPSGLSLQRAPTRYAHPSPFLLYETEHLNLSHLYSDQIRSNYKCRSFCKAKIIRHTCVQPCPLLDPPLVAAALRDPIKIGFWVCPRPPRRGWRTSRQTSSGIDDSFHRQSSRSKPVTMILFNVQDTGTVRLN